MPQTILERIIEPDRAGGERRVPIHAAFALFQEMADGQITVSQLRSILGLDPADPDLTALVNLYQAATDKPKFLSVLKRAMYLAEMRLMFTTPSEFKQRLTGL